MIGCDFYYNNKALSDFGMIMVKPDNDDTSGLNRELLKGEVTSYRKVANHYGTKYSDVIILYFLIIKHNFDTDNSELTYDEMRALQSWVTSKETPSPLTVLEDENTKLEYRGVFTEVSPYEEYGLNGLKLTFTCDSAFGYEYASHIIEVDGSKQKSLVCDTDENDYIYPTITLYPTKSGAFSITNSTDNNTFSLNLDTNYRYYVIDCKYKRILTDKGVLSYNDVGWNIDKIIDFNGVNTESFKIYWLRLLPDVNKLELKGNAKCIIDYKVPVKIGGI